MDSQVLEGTREEIISQLEKGNFGGRTLRVTVAPLETHKPKPTAKEIAEADARLFRHVIDLRYATGLDNESIDADLAREYQDNHAAPPSEKSS